MDWKSHILSQISAPWVAWVMLFLLLCCALAEMVQRGVIRQAFGTLFAKIERSYGDAQQNKLAELVLYVFRLGTFAMALYLCCSNFGKCWKFDFLTYLPVVLIVFLTDILKWSASALVSYTFQIGRRFPQLSTHYNNLWTVISVVFYVALLCLLPLDNEMIVVWVLFGLAALTIVLISIKWIRVFCVNLRSLLYILLYILTLEVLPLLLQFGVALFVVNPN